MVCITKSIRVGDECTKLLAEPSWYPGSGPRRATGQADRPADGVRPAQGGKLRDVPLPDVVSDALAAHITHRSPIDVPLSWKTPDGPPVTTKLLFYSRERKALNRNYY